MKRYAAFLRGVMPGKPPMTELKAAYERAGFEEVRTLLSSGNVVFSASGRAIEKRCEDACEEHLGKRYLTFVRPVDELRALIDRDPYAQFKLPAGMKRIVTFFKAPPSGVKLPLTNGGMRLLCVEGHELFAAYTPGQPEFMALLEKTFGKDVTTRTWDTVRKAAT